MNQSKKDSQTSKFVPAIEVVPREEVKFVTRLCKDEKATTDVVITCPVPDSDIHQDLWKLAGSLIFSTKINVRPSAVLT